MHMGVSLYVWPLSPTANVSSPRHFPSDVLELGAANLLVTAPGICMCARANGGT